MKLSCGCGIIIGFLLALLLVLYLYCRKNPAAAEKGMTRLESGWDKTKNAGDSALRDTRSKVVPENQSGK